jgi:hypothetical protein
VEIKRVNNLHELLRALQDLGADGKHCFRGQASAAWGLVPSIYRGASRIGRPLQAVEGTELAQIERDVYRQFSLHARRFLPPMVNGWDEIAIAQHHGVPTRLLDWTLSPFVAAYFALMEDGAEDPAIWALNLSRYPFPSELGRRQMNHAHRTENVEQFLGSQPRFLQKVTVKDAGGPTRASLVVFEAPTLGPRIAAQQGLFSVHVSSDDYPIVDHAAAIRAVEEGEGLRLLTQIVIPRAAVGRAREQLHVDPATIFPDIEGVAISLRRQTQAQIDELLRGR